MTQTRVGRPTAVDDVYRWSWADDQVVTALPTGHQSFKAAWQLALEPNDFMPISQSLTVGHFVPAIAQGVHPDLLEGEEISAWPSQADISVAERVYESRRREALNSRVADTLNDLALTYGAAWVDIAAILGVSVPGLRKWRLAEAKPRRHHRERLAAYVACLAALRECGVDEPAGRLEVRLLDSYSVTLAQLFEPERVPQILRYASGDLTAVEVLDALSPDWREVYAAKTQIYLDGDGELAMRFQSER